LLSTDEAERSGVVSAAVCPRRSRTRSARWHSPITPYLFVFPGLLFVVVFTVYPIGSLLVRSLFRENTAHPNATFTGLANFKAIFNDPVFLKSLEVTGLYVLVVAPVSVAIGLLIAQLINRKGVVAAICRTAFFYPIVLPLVSAASIWLFIMTPDYGLLTHIKSLIHLGQSTPLANPGTALWAIGVVAVWRQAGFYAIFLLAGLQAIDPDVEHAARLDGASRLRVTLHIRIPLLWPTLVFVLTLAMFSAFQTVDLVYVMTQGGPIDSTRLLLFDIYQTAFSYQNTGWASAQSVVFLAILAIIAAFQIFVVDRMRGDGDA
jgi:sn-glycerol 3-phosphate transport system permease protein